MRSPTSVKVLLGLIVAVIFFHTAVLLKLIPYDIAWGGRLQNDSEMYVFEVISIFINLILGALVMTKGRLVKSSISEKIIDVILWVFFALFILNTIGNLFAKTNFEKSFAALTLVFAFLIWTILRANRIEKKVN